MKIVRICDCRVDSNACKINGRHDSELAFRGKFSFRGKFICNECVATWSLPILETGLLYYPTIQW